MKRPDETKEFFRVLETGDREFSPDLTFDEIDAVERYIETLEKQRDGLYSKGWVLWEKLTEYMEGALDIPGSLTREVLKAKMDFNIELTDTQEQVEKQEKK